MGSGWVHISPLPVPYLFFEIRENPNPYPNPVKSGKTRQIRVGLGGYPWTRVLLPCLFEGSFLASNWSSEETVSEIAWVSFWRYFTIRVIVHDLHYSFCCHLGLVSRLQEILNKENILSWYSFMITGGRIGFWQGEPPPPHLKKIIIPFSNSIFQRPHPNVTQVFSSVIWVLSILLHFLPFLCWFFSLESYLHLSPQTLIFVNCKVIWNWM